MIFIQACKKTSLIDSIRVINFIDIAFSFTKSIFILIQFHQKRNYKG